MGRKPEQPTPPFSALYDKAENGIAKAINEAAHIYGVPFFLIEGILTKFLYQTKDAARAEREDSLNLYKQKIKEFEESKNNRKDNKDV